MAEALYRKYRPQIFEDMVGQDHIARTLKNAIEQDKVSHAYLFTGPRGTGKTTSARLLAKALLCEAGPCATPDGTCTDCQLIAAGEHPDVNELDAASRTGVENVREEIIGRVAFAPQRGRYKVYIIDEVHMLSTAAFNALLKTLEEPPDHVVFILCTTDPRKVPETIHSRCQRFDFHRISNEEIVSRLGAICVSEGVQFEGDALELVATRAEGGMRNALTSLEQLIAFTSGNVTMADAQRILGATDSTEAAELMRAIGMRDVAAAFRWIADYLDTGADLAQFARDLAERVRTLYVLSLAGVEAATILEVDEGLKRELTEELPLYGSDRLARMLSVLGDLLAELRTTLNPRLSFEIALTRMMHPESDLTLEALAERIEALERGNLLVGAMPTLTPTTTIPMAESTAATSPVAATASTMPAEPIATTAMQGATATTAESSAPTSKAPGAESIVATSPVTNAETTMPAESSVSSSSATNAESAVSTESTAQAMSSVPAEATMAVETSTNTEHKQAVKSEQMFDNPAVLQRVWQSALTALKKSKAAYGVLFLNTKAVFDAATSGILIEFPAENDFAFKAVQKPEVHEELSAALKQACGCTIPFTIVKAGETGSTTSPSKVATSASTSQPTAVVTPQAATVATPQASVQSSSTSTIATSKEAASASTPQATTVATSQSTSTSDTLTTPQASFASESSAPGQIDDDVPPWEEVPLSAYEDIAPVQSLYDEVLVPMPSDATSAPSLSPEATSTPSPVSEAAGQPVETMSPMSAQQSNPLDEALVFGFGDGVMFDEVVE